ncbi:MAG: ABC transporter permease, partial [Myxococcota bacterium]
ALEDERGELPPELDALEAEAELPAGAVVASVDEANAWLAELGGEPEGGADEPLPTPEDVATPGELADMLAGLDDPSEPGPELEDWERRISEEQLAEREDAGEDLAALPGLVIGKTLAENVGLEVGDRVRLVSPLSGLDIGSVGEGRVPRSRDFRVIGVFQAGFQEYDTRLVYADLHEAQHFYGQGDAVTGVEMRVDDLERSEAIAWELERELGGPFHTIDWAELNVNLFTALRLQKLVLSLVIATLIFVAAFTVVATLIMIVLEKRREIAILKAMGATSWTVLRVFVVQGTIIGLVGTLVGLALGGAVVAYLATLEFPLDPKVYLIDHLPVVVDGSEFVITAVVSLLICSLSTVAPSAWAANMLPVEGLRYE